MHVIIKYEISKCRVCMCVNAHVMCTCVLMERVEVVKVSCEYVCMCVVLCVCVVCAYTKAM